MALPTDTANFIYRTGTAPNTRAAVSQKNKLYGYGVSTREFHQLGAISEFGHDESRTIDPIRGVGYGDQIAELVPGVTEPMTLTLNKTLLYALNLFQALGYRGGVSGLVRSLKHHRWPFDIKQELVFSEIAGNPSDLGDIGGVTDQALPNANVQASGQEFLTPIRALFTFYEGCWFNSYSASYTSDSAIVAENSSVTVTDIIDGRSQYGEFVDTGLAPVASNGVAGSGFSLRYAGGSAQNALPNL
jgi:hypothetical protein